jgi:GNAT superfamily N-acetyltransferase
LCGDEDLDDFIRDDAWRLQSEHVAVTYVARDKVSGEVAGYCTLLNDAVRLLTRERKKLGLASDDHPIVPAVKIARLGVSIDRQGTGVGVLLVRSAYYAARRDDSTSGCRLLTVDAYPTALPFYEKLGFEPNKAPDYRDRENPSLRLDVFSRAVPDWI